MSFGGFARMSRRNIFELLAQEMDLDSEISKLCGLCREKMFIKRPINPKMIPKSYTLDEFVDVFCLHYWKNRNRCTSVLEIQERLGIDVIEFEENIPIEQVLIYLEYMANMILLCEVYLGKDETVKVTRYYNYLQDNISEILADLNYELKVYEDEEQVLVVEKNPATTAVAEIVDTELAKDVIEYNHHALKGDIAAKRKILLALSDKFEPIRGELKKYNKDLESNTGYLLNKMNIRHNNLEGKNAIPYVQKLSKEELEEWYDEIYQMLLLCILEYDNIERTKKVDVLKKIIEN